MSTAVFDVLSAILCILAEFFKNSIGPTRIINRSNRPQLISHNVPMTYSPSHKNIAEYLVNQPVYSCVDSTYLKNKPHSYDFMSERFTDKGLRPVIKRCVNYSSV